MIPPSRRRSVLAAACIGIGAAVSGCESSFDLNLEVGPSDPEATAAPRAPAQKIGGPDAPLPAAVATRADAPPAALPDADPEPPPEATPAPPPESTTDPFAVALVEFDAWEVYRVCGALVAVRDFRRFDLCHAALKDRVGDGTLSESGLGGREWNRAATVLRLQELQAQSLLDRGRLDEAEAAAFAAVKAAEDGPNFIVDEEATGWLMNLVSRRDYGDPERPFAHLGLRPLGLAAAIAARRGEMDLARAYVAQIDAFDPALGGRGHAFLWRRWRAIGHFVLGDFEQTYKTLSQSPAMGIGSGMYQALAGIGIVEPDVAPPTADGPARPTLDPRFVMELEHEFMRLRSALETGRLDIARAGLDVLLAEPRLEAFPGLYARVLHDRGRVAARDGAYEGAIATFELAITLFEGYRTAVATGVGVLEIGNDRAAVYGDMVEAQLALDRPEIAFAYTERARSRARVDRLATTTRFAGAPAGLEPALQTLARREEEAALLAGVTPAEAEVRARDALALLELVERETPGLRPLLFVDIAPLETLQAGLGEDEALVSYYHHGDSLFAFLLTRTELRALTLDGEDLEALVAGFLRAVQNPRRRAYVSGARRLYTLLLQPLEAAIGARRLTIVPHGPLEALPFAALRDDQGFLPARSAIGFLPAAQALILPEGASQAQDLVLFDPPETGQPSPDEPGAPLETAAVSDAQPAARLAVGRGATETLFRSLAPSAARLHLAVRCEPGISGGRGPVLLLVPDGSNDGKITLSDLYDIRLVASSVTLSRCRPGVDGTGDAMLGGISEGLLDAGAGAAVVSLWPVADEAAADMMRAFYGAAAATSPAAAFRAAQQAVARDRPHPYYWAGFQWIGRPSAAPPPASG